MEVNLEKKNPLLVDDPETNNVIVNTESTESTEASSPDPLDSNNPAEEDSGKKRKKCCCIAHWIADGVLLLAVIALFILHFVDGKQDVTPVVTGEPGNGSVIYVNIDSVNANYEMVSLLTDSIEAEKQRQTIVFQNRQKALEQKLANYQNNVQNGQLTAQQAQYAEQSLQQESQRLQNDYATAVEDLETRYAAALSQIADSLKAAALRANKKYNASYVFSYGNGGQILCADPTKDITNEVLKDLNKPFKKSKKKK